VKISFFLFDKDMCILIGKTLKYFHVIGKTNILLTWSYAIVNCIKEDNALKTCYYQQGSKLLQIQKANILNTLYN